MSTTISGDTGVSQVQDGVITQADLATNVAGNGPAFSAYQSTAQSALPATTWTKISLQTEEFDTNSNFDSATNYRFTPTVAGYYQLNAGIQFNGTSSAALAGIYKNGTVYKWGVYAVYPSGVGSPGSVVSSLVYLNGSTDYVEFYGYTGSSLAPVASSNTTYFNGALVRSAT